MCFGCATPFVRHRETYGRGGGPDEAGFRREGFDKKTAGAKPGGVMISNQQTVIGM
jgi:hypothetical protein